MTAVRLAMLLNEEGTKCCVVPVDIFSPTRNVCICLSGFVRPRPSTRHLLSVGYSTHFSAVRLLPVSSETTYVRPRIQRSSSGISPVSSASHNSDVWVHAATRLTAASRGRTDCAVLLHCLWPLLNQQTQLTENTRLTLDALTTESH